MKKIVTTSLVALALVVSANAKNWEVDQKGKTFVPSALTVHKGDTITFKNSDPFAHNAYTDEETNEFDVGMQATGKETKMTVNSAESFSVECAIHPNMLLEVTVE